MKLRRRVMFTFAVALVVVGAALLTNIVPYKQIIDQRTEVEAAAAELEAISKENALLTAQRDALQTPVEIERLAREKLGYVRPGETAYVVLEPPSTTTSTLAPSPADPVADSETTSQADAASTASEPADDSSLLETMWDFVTGADLSE